MLLKDVKEEDIILFLKDKYNLEVQKIIYLPLGEDGAYYWIYHKNKKYFLKVYVKGEIYSKSKKELETINDFLYDLKNKYKFNHSHVPFRNKNKKTISIFKGRPFILWEFIEGINPKKLTQKEYNKLGRIIAELHNIPKYNFLNIKEDKLDLSFEKKIFEILKTLKRSNFKKGTSYFELKELFLKNNTFISESFNFLKKESKYTKGRRKDYVLSHGDLHKGNILNNKKDLYLIDWEHLELALPERDLMWFRKEDNLNESFSNSYKHISKKTFKLDKRALKFYTLKKGLDEFVFFSNSILSNKHSEEDSNKKIRFMTNQFKALQDYFKQP